MTKVKETVDRRGSLNSKMHISGARPRQATSAVILQKPPWVFEQPQSKVTELRPRAPDLLEAPRGGWEHSRSHWNSGTRHFSASPAAAASPDCPGSLLCPLARSLCPSPRSSSALSNQAKERIYSRWKHRVLPRQFCCHKGWELRLFTLCQHPAQSHQLSLCPFSIISSEEVKPLTSRTNHTRAAAEWIVTLSEEDTRLRNAVTPCWESTDWRYSPGARQDHQFGSQFGSVRVQTHPLIGCRWCHARALIPGDCRFNITPITTSSANYSDHAPWRKLLERRTKQLVETGKVASPKWLFLACLLSKWSCWGQEMTRASLKGVGIVRALF